MPNWCMTNVCFKGKPENIQRLRRDIEKTAKWTKEHGKYFCNLRYFLSLNNFDPVSYQRCNFRGNTYDYNTNQDPESTEYYTLFEMAWYTDYEILQLISVLYDVEFSAYSEEPGMGIYEKCRNGNIDTYDFDYVISPDYDQFEKALDEDPDGIEELCYSNPVKIGSSDEKDIIDLLNDCGIKYDIINIDNWDAPNIYGVYYQLIYGVDYDNIETGFVPHRYPGIDRFNRPVFNGVYYDNNK